MAEITEFLLKMEMGISMEIILNKVLKMMEVIMVEILKEGLQKMEISTEGTLKCSELLQRMEDKMQEDQGENKRNLNLRWTILILLINKKTKIGVRKKAH